MSEHVPKFLLVGILLIILGLGYEPRTGTSSNLATNLQGSTFTAPTVVTFPNQMRTFIPLDPESSGFQIGDKSNISPLLDKSPALQGGDLTRLTSLSDRTYLETDLRPAPLETTGVHEGINSGSSQSSSPEISTISPQLISLGAILGQSDGPAVLTFVKRNDEPAPQLKVRAAVVADLQTGEKYLGNGEFQDWPVASLTKLVTAALAWDVLPLLQTIGLTEEDFRTNGSSTSVLNPGEIYKVQDLIQAMLTVSSNEAAEALANAYGQAAFLNLMNERARNLGLLATSFVDPTGLSPLNHSTASDLVQLTRSLFQHYPAIFALTRSRQIMIQDQMSGRRLILKNLNLFAGRADFLGGKTGHIDESGGNLVSIFSISGRPLIVTVLGSRDRFNDTEKLLRWFKRNYQ